MQAQIIKNVVSDYLTRKRRMAVAFEVGVCRRGRLRADVLALNLKKNVVIVEVKSSVQDYRTDKKWMKYLDFCTQFYWAMDVPTYNKVKNTIPDGTGVMVVGSSGKIKVVKNARTRKLDTEILLNLSLRLNYRAADRTLYRTKAGSIRN